jgi:hypothetical protein
LKSNAVSVQCAKANFGFVTVLQRNEGSRLFPQLCHFEQLVLKQEKNFTYAYENYDDTLEVSTRSSFAQYFIVMLHAKENLVLNSEKVKVEGKNSTYFVL